MFAPDSSIRRPYFPIVIALALSACGGGGGGGGGDDNGFGGSDGRWLIPTADVVDGGPGRDGIPALDEPLFEAAATIMSLQPTDLVIVVRDGDQVKAYPEDIMDYHEIVNDGPDNDPFVVSYCPLTASALAWKGRAGDVDPTYGVSGLLFNSNLMLFDRESESVWSQMLQLSVTGERIGQRPEVVQVLETTFATLQSLYPEALVMTRDTGHFRFYDDYPYGLYREVSDLLFPVSRTDNRLHAKERAIGIHADDRAKVYQIAGFGEATQTINDQFGNQSIVVVGNSSLDLAAIYSRQLADGTILSFDPVQDDLPNVMTDAEGNVWDVFGTAVAGPRTGEQLESVQSYTAMWFAWAAHFDTVEIHFN